MYREGNFDLTIPFKKGTDVSVNGFQHYKTTTKKQETIEFYDYFYHRQNFGFTWSYSLLDFGYTITLSADKENLL